MALVLTACGADDNETDTAAATPGPVVYVFGDSLSDTGNLGRPATFSDDLPPPFYQNRISNGPVIVDYVAQALGRSVAASNYLSLDEEGTNYAIAGAQAYSDDVAIDLAAQISSFGTKNDDKADPNAIYLIFIGGNDVIGAVGAGPEDQAELDLSASEIAKAVQDLTAMGARRFFVLTVPDIGKTPKFINDTTAGAATRLAQASSLTIGFNDSVRNKLAALPPSDASVEIIDVFAILNDVLARVVQLNYIDTTRACYLTSELRFNDFCNETLIEGFAFFDEIHPSGSTHKFVGSEVAAQIINRLN